MKNSKVLNYSLLVRSNSPVKVTSRARRGYFVPRPGAPEIVERQTYQTEVYRELFGRAWIANAGAQFLLVVKVVMNLPNLGVVTTR